VHIHYLQFRIRVKYKLHEESKYVVIVLEQTLFFFTYKHQNKVLGNIEILKVNENDSFTGLPLIYLWE
jgi:hypothetical protein